MLGEKSPQARQSYGVSEGNNPYTGFTQYMMISLVLYQELWRQRASLASLSLAEWSWRILLLSVFSTRKYTSYELSMAMRF